MDVTISPAHGGPGLNQARALFTLYAQSLGFSLDFQSFDEELASLPGKYAPPGGAILLAHVAGDAAGCVALRPLDTGIGEMKRLFVTPGHRGAKVGLLLARAVIDLARNAGYRALRLDTLDTMVQANRLYESLGFYDIAPYCANPFPNARFLELTLQGAGA